MVIDVPLLSPSGSWLAAAFRVRPQRCCRPGCRYGSSEPVQALWIIGAGTGVLVAAVGTAVLVGVDGTVVAVTVGGTEVFVGVGWIPKLPSMTGA